MLKKKKNNTNYIIIIIILVAVFFFMKEIFLQTAFKLENLILPIQTKIYSVTKDITSKKDMLDNKQLLIEERDRMKNELIQKSLVEEENRLLINENIRMRRLLGIKNMFAFNFKVAKINFQQSRDLYESFVVDLGKNDNIKENMPVMYNDSLIGKIYEVHDTYSVVQMITYQDSITSVIAGNNHIGVLRGEKSGELLFEPNSMYETEIYVGDKVYTSGISDIYPKNIYVGTISKVIQNGDEKEYILKLPFDIVEMYEVLIITEVGK